MKTAAWKPSRDEHFVLASVDSPQEHRCKLDIRLQPHLPTSVSDLRQRSDLDATVHARLKQTCTL